MAVMLVLGLGLFSYSLTLPYYTNQRAADNLLNGSMELSHADYYRQDAALRTNKVACMDLGAGLAIAAATMLSFLLMARVRTFSDCKEVKSLSKTRVFIASNLVWLLLLPGTYWYYLFRGGRGDYPPFADSIMIPIVTQIPVYLFAFIPLNLFLFLTTLKTNLPATIFIKAAQYDKAAILWEVFFGFWLLINLLCFVSFMVDGDHFSVPVNLFFTYVLLTLRAGQISKRRAAQPLVGAS